jgi:CubicO group peptidase (beta-lactamase class C family)
MTFSVAKSYLSTVAGLAFDRGMIADLDRPVAKTVTDGGYASTHNAPITWRMHLNQTSEWEGNLWGKPDRADRRNGYDRTLGPPGSVWEYNDVRVNRLALSLLRVWNRPLPAVLKREIMDPIGASTTWEWHGYRTSMTQQDGRQIESVSGGGHWGGGVWASTRDHARFGYLLLRRGRWKNQQLLSDQWVTLATTRPRSARCTDSSGGSTPIKSNMPQRHRDRSSRLGPAAT